MKMNLKGKVSPDTPPPEVHVKPTTYQPNKAELEEPIRLDATPEELARAVMQPANAACQRDHRPVIAGRTETAPVTRVKEDAPWADSSSFCHSGRVNNFETT